MRDNPPNTRASKLGNKGWQRDQKRKLNKYRFGGDVNFSRACRSNIFIENVDADLGKRIFISHFQFFNLNCRKGGPLGPLRKMPSFHHNDVVVSAVGSGNILGDLEYDQERLVEFVLTVAVVPNRKKRKGGH